MSKLPANPSELIKDPTFYRHVLSKLNYLTLTPPFAFAVQHLSQYMQDPRAPYLNAALRVLPYLLKDTGLRLFMSSSPSFELVSFCNSDWGACPNLQKSVSLFYITLTASPVFGSQRSRLLYPSALLKLRIGPWGELLLSGLGWYDYWMIFQFLYLCWFFFTRIAKMQYIFPRIPFFMIEPSMWSLIDISSYNSFFFFNSTLCHSIFVSISRFINQALHSNLLGKLCVFSSPSNLRRDVGVNSGEKITMKKAEVSHVSGRSVIYIS